MIVSNYAIKFRTAVFVFIIVLIIAGIGSYKKMPREGSPDITIPFVFITAFYEGTAPSEMETLVTIPIEKKLNEVEGVKEITSTTLEGLCTIAIEFVAGEDIDQARQQAKDKVDLARPDLPDDIEEPVVDAFNFSSDTPILTFALWGDATLDRLKNLAEELEDEMELVSGVKDVVVSGVREREIRVELDLRRLVAYDIPIGLVMQRIAQENKTISAGNLEAGDDKFQVRIPGEYKLVPELEDLLLAEHGGRPIYLRDVAGVSDTYKDLDSISRLNGKPSVSVGMKKRSGENSVALIRRVKEILEASTLPPGIHRTIVYDESDYVDMMLSELENNIVTGFILVIAVLVIFMGWRNSLFVAVAIPFSMLVAFSVMNLLGFSLNMIVLFSLVLSVGMLVDNAIVIVENIYRNRTLGMSRIKAARTGAGEVAWPVITSTLTTCAAFSPLLFWPDIMGQFMSFLPKTLIVTLAASLFVAIVINPAVCSALIQGAKPGAGKGKLAKKGHAFVGGYEAMLRGALRHRGAVMLLGFLFLIFTVMAYGRWGRGVELFPEIAPRNAVVKLKFAQGTSIEETDAAIRRIEQLLPKYSDIEFFLSTVGAGTGGVLEGGATGPHQGSIHIEFLDIQDREGDTLELVETLRKEVGTIAGAEVTVAKQEEGPPVGAPVAIELSGDDFDTLSECAARITAAVEGVPGLVDLTDDYEEALPELQFRVDRNRAAMLGLDTDAIGLFLRTGIYGIEMGKFRSDEDEYDITLRLPEGQRDRVELLDEIFIPVPGGRPVPLSSLGEVAYVGGRGAITRLDQKRVITVSGNNEGRGEDEILKDIQPLVAGVDLPRGYAVRYRGKNEDMQESTSFLSGAFLIALGLILVILVVQFNSPILPLIIIFSIILSLIGVMWGLLACGMRFGVIMTGVGVISLAGIVVNNAIVLVDCVRQRQAEGLSMSDAVVAAGRLRLRPVLLTAATTILGLIPMAVGYSLEIHEMPPRIVAGAESSAWWAPMAVAVIFGLGVSTVLTLVLVPVMCSVADSLAGGVRRVLGWTGEDEE